MKRIALFLISFTLFTIISQTTNAQSKKRTDAEKENLRGKVMSVKDKYYEEGTTFFGLIPFKKKFWDEYKEFNKEGNFVFEDKPSYHGGNYRDRSFYKYDERGNCIEQINSNYENGNKYTYSNHYKYIYDEYGNIINENWYSYDRLVYKYYYKYNDSGYCIEQLSYKNENDSTPTKENYIRDNKGNIIETKKYSSFGDSKIVYEYDNKGNRIKEEYYDKADNEPKRNLLYKYNEEKDIVEEIHSDNYYTIKYIYKYDSKGNWKTQTKYKGNGSIDYIVKREIKYYKD